MVNVRALKEGDRIESPKEILEIMEVKPSPLSFRVIEIHMEFWISSETIEAGNFWQVSADAQI